MTDNLKTAICDALTAFIRQRPGFDPCNYGDAASYRADSRTATLQKRDAETLLQAVRWRESITAADIIEAARGGRLTITTYPDSTAVDIDYTVGQYWPTEFRAGVCRVLSSALWNWQRESMPAPVAHRVEWPDGTKEIMHIHAAMDARQRGAYVSDLYTGSRMSAGDWLRAKFRREFGSSLARRWFN